MSFLNPFFLIALVSIAIPLLIYLLNLRKPKKVLFSTLSFFESLKSTALKRIKLKRIFLLSLRILAIIMLVLAASRPFLPGDAGTGREGEPAVSVILIDNSPSMEQIDRNGPYFDQALKLAKEIVEMAGPDDRFALIGTHGESVSMPFMNRNGVLGNLARLSVQNKGNFTASRIEHAALRLAGEPEPNKRIYFITDGREGQFQGFADSRREFDETTVTVLNVGSAPASNTGFGYVELEQGMMQGELSLRAGVQNFGEDSAQNQFVNFYIGEELISQHAIELDPGENRELIFDLPGVERRYIDAILEIEGDELTFDNRYYVPVQLPDIRQIAVIADAQPRGEFRSYLEPVFELMNEESDRFQVSFYTVNDLDADELSRYHAVVFDGLRTIPDYISQPVLEMVQEGGGALLIPSAEGNLNSYNRFIDIGGAGGYSDFFGSYGSFDVIDRMAVPDGSHPLIQTIFDKQEDEEIRLNAPELFYYLEIEPSGGSGSFPVLSTRTGNPLLQESRVGNGRLIYSAIGSDPGWSNFPVKPFFAPIFYRAVEYLARGEGAVMNTRKLGETFEVLIAESADDPLFVKGEEEVAPVQVQRFDGTLLRHDAPEWTPGWVKVRVNDQEKLFSVNQNAMESSLISLPIAEQKELLENWFEQVVVYRSDHEPESVISQLQAASFGKEIWSWFIIASILLLIAESLVSRYYKIETQ